MSKRKYMLKSGVDEVLGAHVHLQRHDNGVSPRVELDEDVASLYPGGLVPAETAGAETGSDATTEDTSEEVETDA